MAAVNNRYLGLNFTDHSLFYAVSVQKGHAAVEHIGSYDFHFNVTEKLRHSDDIQLDGIRKIIDGLKEEFDISGARMVVQPQDETWTSFPKLVKDRDDERKAHLDIVSRDIPASNRQLLWFDLSKPQYKFLVVRDKKVTQKYQTLTRPIPQVELVSEFEIGERWLHHANNKGSFLTISCSNSTLAVTSYMLGKLRAATYLQFDHIDDLPYLWVLHATHLPWLRGFHEQIYFYGENPQKVLQQINPYLDQGAEFVCLNTLDMMGIECEEKTYGFDLAKAFPALMVAFK